jgi:subtilisin family serine protease
MKRLGVVFFVVALVVGVLAAGSALASVDKFSKELTHILNSSPAGMKHSMIVHLTDQVDIRALDEQLYQQSVTRQYRHKTVVEALQAAAARSQGPVRAFLDELVQSGEVEGYTAYWIVNCFVVYGTDRAAGLLAERDDIAFLEDNFKAQLIDPVPPAGRHLDDDANTPPPGVVAVHAPQVWYQLGIQGEGALIGGLDTGVDGSHPALGYRWRGNFAPWQECWRSPVSGTSFPVDYGRHGTHTMGTMTGATVSSGTGDTVGVAPAALWIADDAINQSVTPQLDSDILDGFQWFADPDGNPETVEDVPDVVQNSWGVYSYWPGYQDCDNRWDAAILALEAGGTVVTFSAGNEGPGAQTMRSPANACYDSVSFFSIGADSVTGHSWPYPIANFSSRGPSDCDHLSIKPEVVAPGVSVYSTVPGGSYEQSGWDGTSMAGPHVAGTVALMRSVNPNIDVRVIKSILMRTARDEGTTGEDNTYGWGFIDAYAAVVQAMGSEYGRVMGTVRDAVTHNGIQARVEVVGGTQGTTCSGTGSYVIVLPGDSTYTLRYSLYGYVTQEHMVSIAVNDTTFQDVDLVPRPVVTVFSEDFETGAPDWTHSSPSGWGDQWHISTEMVHGGTHSYKCGDTGTGTYANLLDAQLVSPTIANLPNEARLYFWMWIEGELSGAYQDSAYDGGILEVSADGGAFTEVAPVAGYPKTFRWLRGGGNPATGPMRGMPCWADNTTWTQVAVDLTPFAGQSIQLRYRFGSDAGTGYEGWYVDDVLITAFGEPVTDVTGAVIMVEGNDLHLYWNPDSNHGYRIYDDDDPMGSFTNQVGETTATDFVVSGGAASADMKFYIIRGWDGGAR